MLQTKIETNFKSLPANGLLHQLICSKCQMHAGYRILLAQNQIAAFDVLDMNSVLTPKMLTLCANGSFGHQNYAIHEHKNE